VGGHPSDMKNKTKKRISTAFEGAGGRGRARGSAMVCEGRRACACVCLSLC